MERVLGLGGVFFRARDPQALALWYERTLGVDPVPSAEGALPWQQEAGFTVFAPFEMATEYFGNPDKVFMLNFRVRDLDAMIAQIEATGTRVVRDPQDYPHGRFARFTDPEGNPIELWEPAIPG